MGFGNTLVLAQVTAFLVSFIVSFLIFIPVSVNVNEFDGHCLLYADGKWMNGTEGTELRYMSWGPYSACGFNVFMGVIVMLLSLFYIIWESIYLVKETDSSWLDAFVTVIVCLTICLMLFASSLTLSVGFTHWCDTLVKSPSKIEKCELAEFIKFTDATDIKAENFYVEMTMAQFGSWICWLCWLLLTIFAFAKVVRYHRQEAISISLNRERQRLLQRVGHQSANVL